MKKVSEVYKKLGIDFTLPIIIENAEGKVTYYETYNGFWSKSKYDVNGNQNYFETSYGFWSKHEYDENNKESYYEDSDGNKKGTPRSQFCVGKVIEVDGKKYRLEILDKKTH